MAAMSTISLKFSIGSRNISHIIFCFSIKPSRMLASKRLSFSAEVRTGSAVCAGLILICIAVGSTNGGEDCISVRVLLELLEHTMLALSLLLPTAPKLLSSLDPLACLADCVCLKVTPLAPGKSVVLL